MSGPLVAIFHQPPRDGDLPLTALLAAARSRLVAFQTSLFERAGAGRVLVIPGREEGGSQSFGERLARLIAEEGVPAGLVVLGSGAVPLLRRSDALELVQAASARGRVALTNNRYSSDVCAISDAKLLRALPPLPSDNALPRWLEERAGVSVKELPGRDRLALDLDTPLDLALLSLVPRSPRELRRLAAERDLAVPRLDVLRALAADPRRELLVFGRSGSRTLRWLERSVRCRVRFLAEERGLRASSALAIRGGSAALAGQSARPPASTLGTLLEQQGPGDLAKIVAQLSDGAIIDTRVLMASRLGAGEDTWPRPEDRFASDLLRPDGIRDRWLRALTLSAAHAPIPILLGAHTLVGPGIPILLAGTSTA